MFDMIRPDFICKDLFLYCTNEVPKNHNQFWYFRQGREMHFLVLAQTLIVDSIVYVLWWEEGSTVKYSLSTREIPREEPEGFPEGSGYISQ